MKRRPLLTFFALTFTITWGLAALFLAFSPLLEPIFGPIGENNPVYWLAVFSPSISAVVVTGWIEGRAGVSALLARLVRWRFSLLIYLFILAGIPLLGVVAGAVNGTLQAVTLAGFVAARFGGAGPLGEELGWRGFALPRLLARHSPLTASLILGVIWGVWHLPSFALAGLGQSALSLPIFLVGAVALSVIATAVYQASQGSVFSAVLLHMMVNLSINAIAGSFNAMTVTLIVAALLVAAGWRVRNVRTNAVEVRTTP
jgi:hypothetical protein